MFNDQSAIVRERVAELVSYLSDTNAPRARSAVADAWHGQDGSDLLHSVAHALVAVRRHQRL